VLFLVVVIAGAHGLWLLPAILSLVGGSKQSSESGSSPGWMGRMDDMLAWLVGCAGHLK